MGFEDHERFVAKNRSLAMADEIDRKDDALEKKGYTHLSARRDASCFNCKMKQTCREFSARRTGGTSGVVSFGGDEKMICDRYEPAERQSKGMNDKQVKSLMKNFKRMK